MARLTYSLHVIDTTCCASVSQPKKILRYKIFILVLTFLVYCFYHLSRKPISVVKNVLAQNCTNLTDPNHTNDTHWCDWKPFDGDDAGTLLGFVDSAFLFAYAIGIFVSGTIAERMDLRIFLGIGMISSGVLCIMFGLGYTWQIHVLWYYILVQVISGLAQSTGWPCVVAATGNWYGKGNRGLIFGIWNTHTSLGNILGTLIAAAFVMSDWSLSFIIPGLLIGSLGIIVLFVLLPEPELVGLPNPNYTEKSHLISYVGKEKGAEFKTPSKEKAITFLGALKIPGVLEFSVCLFFAKLVPYTFLYWLPNYIKNSTPYDSSESANLSTFFDVGGMMGGILAGLLRDKTGMPASICSIMLIFAVPLMFLYHAFGDITIGLNIFMLILVGLLVNGPYSLITTAVSADLGTHESLQGNAKALATVSAIIDGTGSLGAAVGPLIAGPISEIDWGYVFYMLMIADVLALILLLRLVVSEVKGLMHRRRTESLLPAA